RRGIAFNRNTYQTDSEGLFAAGNAVRGKGLVVRSVAVFIELTWQVVHYTEGCSIIDMSSGEKIDPNTR
ncbi:MAG: hypothetical protein R6V32_11080, partial [Bacteroidales bacterium]